MFASTTAVTPPRCTVGNFKTSLQKRGPIEP